MKMSRINVKEENRFNKRLTITEAAEILGVSPKTLARWEKVGKIRKPKRDWRGWRVYDESDIAHIKDFHQAIFEVQ
ncbi:MAG: MerR family transcriptional regulator [Candidatus Omnitrophica bacterium]|jgi:excisionase family DNA binding protein|nr:MerR family transcriptional regulator [Candidatus Omnitrophota bacterium]